MKRILTALLFSLMVMSVTVAFAACSSCDNQPDEEHVHVMTAIEAAQPTCTEPGNEAYYECTECGKYFSDEAGNTEISLEDTVIAAAGHKVEKLPGKAATCTEDGLTEGEKCSVCGEVIKAQEVIKAAGHTPEVVPGKAATCTEDGLTEGEKCSVCGEVIKAQEVIKATGHDMTAVAAKEPACIENGNIAYYVCDVCQLIYADEEGEKELSLAEVIIPATGHGELTYHAGTAASCVTNGKTAYYECPDCGLIFADAEGETELSYAELTIPATGHTLTKHAAVAAGCTSNGTKEYYECSGCGLIFADAEGDTELSYAELTVPATGHDMKYVAAVAATCEHAGNIAHYRCDNCGKYYSDDAGRNQISSVQIPALAHKLTAHAAVEATCTEDGNIAYYTCSACGGYFTDAAGKNKVDEDDVIVKAGHDLTYHEAVPAQCLENGTKEYYECSACGLIFADEDGETELSYAELTIQATGHVELTYHPAVEPGCDTNGSKAYYECQSCGQMFADAEGEKEVVRDEIIINATGHLKLEYHPAVAAGCLENGSIAYYECTECGALFDNKAMDNELAYAEIFVPATGHKMMHHEEVPAQCLANGTKEYYECANCGLLYSDEAGRPEQELSHEEIIIRAPGHGTLVYYTETQPGCVENGYKAHYACPDCGTLFADAEGETEIIRDEILINATGHKMTYHAPVAPECTENGTKEYYECSVCHNLYSSEAGRAEDELSIEEIIVRATGHVNLTYHEEVPAQCLANGTKEYYECECGLLFSDDKGQNEVSQAELVIAATGHINLTYHEEVPAQCLANGTKAYYECECGLLFSDDKGQNEVSQAELVIGATGHADPLTYHAAAEPTCIENGNIAYYECENCGLLFRDGSGEIEIIRDEIIINATGHLKLEYHPAVAVGCLENGVKEYYECVECGLMFADKDMEKELSSAELVVPATGHKMIHHEAVPAQCLVNGTKAYYECENCRLLYSDEAGRPEQELSLEDIIIRAPGHGTLVYYPETQPGCVENGYKAHYACPDCGTLFADAAGKTEIVRDEILINATGHKMTHHAAVAPECLENGTKEYYECTVCHNLYSSEAGRAEDELSIEEIIVRATGHVNLTKHEEVPANCLKNGTKEYYECECGLLFSDDKGQNEVSQAELVIAATGHVNLTYHEEVPAQCLANGTKAYYECECGLMFADDKGQNEVSQAELVSAATGHADPLTYHAAVEPTCTENGNIAYYECENCGLLFRDGSGKIEIIRDEIIINATGHLKLEYHPAVAAGCLENGVKAYYECVECGLKFDSATLENELSDAELVVPAPGHKMIHHEEVPAQCLANGTEEYYECANCLLLYSDEAGRPEQELSLEDIIIRAPGHGKLLYYPETQPGCVENGYKAHYECPDCGTLFADAEGKNESVRDEILINATGHKMTCHAAARNTTNARYATTCILPKRAEPKTNSR